MEPGEPRWQSQVTLAEAPDAKVHSFMNKGSRYRHVEGCAGANPADAASSVSYTHLTLPTICSV